MLYVRLLSPAGFRETEFCENMGCLAAGRNLAGLGDSARSRASARLRLFSPLPGFCLSWVNLGAAFFGVLGVPLAGLGLNHSADVA